MLYGLNNGTRKISATISSVDKELAKAYIHGGVDCFCNNNPLGVFSVQILFGGDNKNWNGTPLQCLYDNHFYIRKSSEPKKQAASDVGILLREVLSSDKRRDFEYVGEATGHQYRMR